MADWKAHWLLSRQSAAFLLRECRVCEWVICNRSPVWSKRVKNTEELRSVKWYQKKEVLLQWTDAKYICIRQRLNDMTNLTVSTSDTLKSTCPHDPCSAEVEVMECLESDTELQLILFIKSLILTIVIHPSRHYSSAPWQEDRTLTLLWGNRSDTFFWHFQKLFKNHFK